MRVIEVKSCRECPLRQSYTYKNGKEKIAWCNYLPNAPMLDLRTKTFPRFCPLKEAKDG